jgi:hypothetical protein
MGVIPREATKKLEFRNPESGAIFSTTDLQFKKHKREKMLMIIKETYTPLIIKKKISTLLIEVNIFQYNTPAKYLKDFKRKLKKQNIILLGYYWQRDVGEKNFTPHFHFIFFIKRICGKDFSKLFKRKKGKYNAIFCNHLKSFKTYLEIKEMYAPVNKRSYGCSREFKTI